MQKYLDIFTDYGFKKIFGEEANKNFLIDFLNALLPAKAHIKDLRFKNTEKLGAIPSDRIAVYDIYCESESGEKFIVEMQRVKRDFFLDRTIYYSSFAINEQAIKGEGWNYSLNPVYCICLLDFTIIDYKKNTGIECEVVQTYTLKNQHNRPGYDKLTYIYLEMPNFTKTEHELETRLDKWFYFINNLDTFDAIPEVFKNEVVFMEALDKAEFSNMSREDRFLYNDSLKRARDEYSLMETKKNEGIKEGIEIGEANMRKYADRQTKQKQIEMAKKCLERGIEILDIADLTGLTQDEIRAIVPTSH